VPNERKRNYSQDITLMKKAGTAGFHAGGQYDFHRAIEKDSAYRQKRTEAKRQRMESLLTERLEEFRQAGYWKRQAILKKIHSQVNHEFSLAHCLF
jgi:hypothetical protein